MMRLIKYSTTETSQDRSKTDGDGYANDAADDDEPEILRRQRGITRVAFNLEPVHRSDDEDIILTEDDDMSFDDTSPLKDVNSNDKRFEIFHYIVYWQRNLALTFLLSCIILGCIWNPVPTLIKIC